MPLSYGETLAIVRAVPDCTDRRCLQSILFHATSRADADSMVASLRIHMPILFSPRGSFSPGDPAPAPAGLHQQRHRERGDTPERGRGHDRKREYPRRRRGWDE